MPGPRTDLTAGEWAALALIAEAPTHGFAVARSMAPEGEVGQIWSLRRPLVYRAIEGISSLGLVAATGTERSSTGPQRTVLAVTAAGKSALERWLSEPVQHVRDARTLLMLKLLFVHRRKGDPTALLKAQQARFTKLVGALQTQLDESESFERTLVLWRLENATAAVRFCDEMLAQ